MRPVFLIEPRFMTPREVALRSCAPNEKEIQELTLYLEISRAEKRYAASVGVSKHWKWGAR